MAAAVGEFSASKTLWHVFGLNWKLSDLASRVAWVGLCECRRRHVGSSEQYRDARDVWAFDKGAEFPLQNTRSGGVQACVAVSY